MAIAGPSYECFYVDVGTNGRVNEGGVWDKCEMVESMKAVFGINVVFQKH